MKAADLDCSCSRPEPSMRHVPNCTAHYKWAGRTASHSSLKFNYRKYNTFFERHAAVAKTRVGNTAVSIETALRAHRHVTHGSRVSVQAVTCAGECTCVRLAPMRADRLVARCSECQHGLLNCHAATSLAPSILSGLCRCTESKKTIMS